MNEATVTEAPLATGSHHPTKDDFPRGPSEPPICGECAVERAYREDALAKGWDLDRILENWTDHPEDQSPTIAAVLRNFNDQTGDSERGAQRRARVADVKLRRAMRNTKGSRELERRRQLALADWSMRVAVPEILARTKSLAHLGEKLAAMPEITSFEAVNAAREQLLAIRDEAWRAYYEQRAKLRQRAAAAVAEAVAAAVAEAEAEAVAVAVAVVAAAAVAVVAAAAVAVAAAAVAVAVAIFDPAVFNRAAEAAEKERISGQDWSSQKRAARAVFDEELAKPEHRATLDFADKHDAELRALLLRLCAMT